MSDSKGYCTILITGANRGVGRGLVEAFLQRPNTTVVAAVRDLSRSSSQSLLELPLAPPGRVILIKINSECPSDAHDAVKELTTTKGISHLDMVIASTSISSHVGRAVTTPVHELQRHFTVNTCAPLSLFQATELLLRKASNPKFFVLSSTAASMGIMERVPSRYLAFGISKAGANYLVRKIHFENKWLIAAALSPGWVQTDLGDYGEEVSGVQKEPRTVAESAKGLVKLIDNATREATSSRFLSAYDGSEVPC